VATAPPVKPAAAKAQPQAKTASSGFGAQLGAYSSRQKAESEWQVAAKRFKAQIGSAKHLILASKVKGKVLYRLQLPQASQAKARALCAHLKAKGQSCVVYHP
jgi:cell division septation protein DedD